MAVKSYVGFDNGTTGSIAVLYDSSPEIHYTKTPIKHCLNYTKTKQWINRIDIEILTEWLRNYALDLYGKDTNPYDCFCYLERPMINPGRFKASVSAIRAFEATTIVLEQLQIPYELLDSKAWQKALLPHGLEKEELKKASLEVGRRLFPQIKCVGDADSLLIAEYCRRVRSGKTTP